jgi:hypothetical protein
MVYKLKDISKYYLFSVGLRFDSIISLASKNLFEFKIGSSLLSNVTREDNMTSSLRDKSSLSIDIGNKDLNRGVIFWSNKLGSGTALSWEVLFNDLFVLVHYWLHKSVLELFVDENVIVKHLYKVYYF